MPADPLGVLGTRERSGLRRAEPGFVSPMLATLTAEHFSDPDWIFERKLDGVRVVIVRRGGRTRLYSRNRKSVDGSFPELVEALDEQAADGLVADGEVVAFDGAATSFGRLQARVGITDPERARATGVPVFLYLFDAMTAGGRDLTGLPLRARKRVLLGSVDFGGPVRFCAHRNAEGVSYLRDACERGWEGLIAKRADAGYRPGRRSPDWLKFKCVRAQEFVIAGYTEPAGTRVGFGALLLGHHDQQGLRYAGKVGTGFDDRQLRSLRERFDTLGRRDSPFDDEVGEPGTHWLRPELVAHVGFTEWTRDGRLRHPRFLGLRTDKAAAEVVREEPDSRAGPAR